MTFEPPIKPIPRSIAVFGCGGRWGHPVADDLRYAAPDIRLRLLTSTEAGAAALRPEFPDAEATGVCHDQSGGGSPVGWIGGQHLPSHRD